MLVCWAQKNVTTPKQHDCSMCSALNHIVWSLEQHILTCVLASFDDLAMCKSTIPILHLRDWVQTSNHNQDKKPRKYCIQWNLSKITTCTFGPVLTDVYREVAALQRYTTVLLILAKQSGCFSGVAALHRDHLVSLYVRYTLPYLSTIELFKHAFLLCIRMC